PGFDQFTGGKPLLKPVAARLSHHPRIQPRREQVPPEVEFGRDQAVLVACAARDRADAGRYRDERGAGG
ncbi:hypothetical protein, partial [uncultured Lamprocystis sp.]|uniref:hypothetical protein n=1 Tax=uncultured Lamprocystis sp. TaxID=543132 RepID=UPI0025F688D4